MPTAPTTTRQRRPRTSPASGNASAPAPAPGWTLQLLDPRSLLLDGNARTRPDLDPEFIESIRQRGVLQAISAVRTEHGIQVRHGQRRTLASIAADRDLVPVLVADTDPGDDAARIIEQFHENTHRKALAADDEVAAVEQLAAFGLSAEDISSQLGAKPAKIQAALAIAGSELARRALPRYELTVDQAAAVAEFADDEDAVKALIAAASLGDGKFEHTLQYMRDERELRDRAVQVEAELAAAGVRVLTGNQITSSKNKKLSELLPPAGRRELTPAKHKRCPGHAAYARGGVATADAVQPVYVCTDWRAHGHRDRWGPDAVAVPRMTRAAAAKAEAEQRARDERRAQEKREWLSAQKVRRAWLKTFLTGSRPPKGSAVFIAHGFGIGRVELRRQLDCGPALLDELIGSVDRNRLSNLDRPLSDGRATMLSLAVILASLEFQLSQVGCPFPTAAGTRYLAFLAAHGYPLAAIELQASGQTPDKPEEPPQLPGPAAEDAA